MCYPLETQVKSYRFGLWKTIPSFEGWVRIGIPSHLRKVMSSGSDGKVKEWDFDSGELLKLAEGLLQHYRERERLLLM